MTRNPMPSKPLWKVSVLTTPEAEDAVAELLNAVFNLPATSYHDFEGGSVTVTVYLPNKSRSVRQIGGDISAGLERIKRCGLAIGPGKIVMATVRRRNWAESWKRHFKPIEIGGILLIKPSWSRRKPRKSQELIILDPGLSFGTGHHPTTAFCLSEIVRARRDRYKASLPCGSSQFRPEPLSFLDLGTGSGILAIAAAKSGFSPVLAMDFDREAIRVARANASANGVQRRLEIRRADVAELPLCPGQRGQKFDLICANLTSDLLISERRRISGRLRASGQLVLAGILTKEFAAVRRVYEGAGLELRHWRREKEWCSGSFAFDKKIV